VFQWHLSSFINGSNRFNLQPLASRRSLIFRGGLTRHGLVQKVAISKLPCWSGLLAAEILPCNARLDDQVGLTPCTNALEILEQCISICDIPSVTCDEEPRYFIWRPTSVHILRSISLQMLLTRLQSLISSR
jgi:hypothetical protein